MSEARGNQPALNHPVTNSDQDQVLGIPEMNCLQANSLGLKPEKGHKETKRNENREGEFPGLQPGVKSRGIVFLWQPTSPIGCPYTK